MPVGRRESTISARSPDGVRARPWTLRASTIRSSSIVLDGPKREYLRVAAERWRRPIRGSGSSSLPRSSASPRPLRRASTRRAGVSARDAAGVLPGGSRTELPKLVAASAEAADADMLIAVRWPRAGGRCSTSCAARRSTGCSASSSGMQLPRPRPAACGCSRARWRRRCPFTATSTGSCRRSRRGADSACGKSRLRQSPKDRFRGHYRLREYLHRFLDVLDGVLPRQVHQEATALLRDHRLPRRRHRRRSRPRCWWCSGCSSAMALAERPALLLGVAAGGARRADVSRSA